MLYYCIFRFDISLSLGLDVLSVGDKILEVNGMLVKESFFEEVYRYVVFRVLFFESIYKVCDVIEILLLKL